jgi:hypothetical protein
VTLGIYGLVASYILLAVLLLSINLYSKWSWQIKATATIVTSAFYVLSYFSFPPLLGWATTEPLPTHFRLLSSDVRQPDKITGDEGAIFLWAKKIENVASYNPPRSYKIPYSKSLHEAVIGAQSKIDRGIAQLGEYADVNRLQQAPVDASRVGQESLDIQFYDLPDPLIPSK